MWIARLVVANLGLVAAAALAEVEIDTKVDSTAHSSEATVGNVRPGRILFLGNSITLHGPNADIGWTNNWGMAASAMEKDYVHIMARSISADTGTSPITMIENIADLERKYGTYDPSRLTKALDFKADTVIVAIGENVPALDSEGSKTKFTKNMLKLLTDLKKGGNPTIIVRSSFWPDKIKDEILRQVCGVVDGVFVDIGGLSKDESHYARSERSYAHSGVAAHPGDKGMQAIADALLAAMKNAKAANE